MRLLPVVLLLAACASQPARTTYRQGAFSPVEAPAFEPSLDAPHTTGQPGNVGSVEGLPRSPHGRVLPQTPETRREAGVWNAEIPAAALVPLTKINVFGMVFAPHEDRAVDEFLRGCAGAIKTRRDKGDLEDALGRMSGKQRRCVAAQILQRCAMTIATLGQKNAMEAEKAARKAVDDACNGGDESDDARHIHAAFAGMFLQEAH